MYKSASKYAQRVKETTGRDLNKLADSRSAGRSGKRTKRTSPGTSPAMTKKDDVREIAALSRKVGELQNCLDRADRYIDNLRRELNRLENENKALRMQIRSRSDHHAQVPIAETEGSVVIGKTGMQVRRLVRRNAAAVDEPDPPNASAPVVRVCDLAKELRLTDGWVMSFLEDIGLNALVPSSVVSAGAADKLRAWFPRSE